MNATLLFTLITLVAGGFGMVMLVIMLRQMRKETRLTVFTPILALAGTILTTLLYLLISRSPLNLALAAGIVCVGLIIGLLEGLATRIYVQGNQVVGKRSGIYLVLWGLAYLVTIGFAQMNNAGLHAFGLMGLAFGLGMSLGSNLNLFFRRLFFRSQ
jgi:hypothetical protein